MFVLERGETSAGVSGIGLGFLDAACGVCELLGARLQRAGAESKLGLSTAEQGAKGAHALGAHGELLLGGGLEAPPELEQEAQVDGLARLGWDAGSLLGRRSPLGRRSLDG
jgi:hypothetical protein